MAVVRVSELQFEQIIEIGFRQMKLSGAIGGCKRFLCQFPFSDILFDKFFVLSYQQFIVQFTDNELPLIKTGGIIQQTGDMPCQNSTFVRVRSMVKFPANIIDTRRKYPSFFLGYMQRFFGRIRKEGILFNRFFKYSAFEQVGMKCNCP